MGGPSLDAAPGSPLSGPKVYANPAAPLVLLGTNQPAAKSSSKQQDMFIPSPKRDLKGTFSKHILTQNPV